MTIPFIANRGDGLKEVAGAGALAYNSDTSLRVDSTGGYGNRSMATDVQTARTSGSSGYTLGVSTAGTTIGCLMEWRDTSDNPVFRTDVTASGVVSCQYWNGSSWTTLGTFTGLSSATQWFIKLDFSGLGTASGALTFKQWDIEGAVLAQTVSGTGLDLSSCANVGKLVTNADVDTSTSYVGEMFLYDGAADSVFGYGNVPTSNGTDQDQISGDEANVDEVGNDVPLDDDFVSLDTSGQRFSVKCAARDYQGRAIKLVSPSWRLRCGATGPTQVKGYLTIGGTRYYWGGGSGTAVTLTTSFEGYNFPFDQDPAATAAWTAAVAEDATLEWGIELV